MTKRSNSGFFWPWPLDYTVISWGWGYSLFPFLFPILIPIPHSHSRFWFPIPHSPFPISHFPIPFPNQISHPNPQPILLTCSTADICSIRPSGSVPCLMRPVSVSAPKPGAGVSGSWWPLPSPPLACLVFSLHLFVLVLNCSRRKRNECSVQFSETFTNK